MPVSTLHILRMYLPISQPFHLIRVLNSEQPSHALGEPHLRWLTIQSDFFAFVVPIIATMFKKPLQRTLKESNSLERCGFRLRRSLSNDIFRHIFGWVVLTLSIGIIHGLKLEMVSAAVGDFFLTLGGMALSAIKMTTLSSSTIETEVVGVILTLVILIGVSEWIIQVFQSKANPTLFLAKQSGN